MQNTPTEILVFFVLITVIFMFLTAIIIGQLYSNKRKQLLHVQQMESFQLRTEKHIIASGAEIRENTMRDISRELHDNIILSLSLSRLYLGRLAMNEPQKSSEEVTDSIKIIGKSIDDLRDISRSLKADLIAEHGLLYTVEQEIERIRRTGLFTIEFTVSDDPVYMDNQKELLIFRIIQEAFSNIIRHSKATHAWLDLDYSVTTLQVRIGDNGQGFIADHTPDKKKGSGLINMRERATLVGGDIKITSAPGNGTLLELNLPIP